jgi:hypothetical protein
MRGMGATMPIGSQRHLFEVPEDVAYFNTASMSPAPSWLDA